MSVFFPAIAFFGAFASTRRSLGAGLLWVVAVGYVNGIVRANFLGVLTTFMFDMAVLGLYLAYLSGPAGDRQAGGGATGAFVLCLVAWPALLSMVPVNNLLVQWVALRSTVWFLPILLIAARATTEDLRVFARGLVALNIAALICGVYIYYQGVGPLYPKNAVTSIIYQSKDVAGSRFHRIPSTFLSAHAYGGTMLLSLPFLMDRAGGWGVKTPQRVWAGVGLAAAAGGMLMCGARLPLVIFGLAMVVAWVLTRFSLRLGVLLAVLVAGGVFVASRDQRFQRASSLDDTEMVTNRIALSANDSFLDLATSYPLGAGMGSSVGTSIPFFLADQAPEQIGLENEYCRILIDQGWVGLGGWLLFLAWLLVRPPSYRTAGPWRLGSVCMYSVVLASWATAFIGSGLLSAVPGAVLLLCQMGILAGIRMQGEVPAAADPLDEDRHRTSSRRDRNPEVRKRRASGVRESLERGGRRGARAGRVAADIQDRGGAGSEAHV